MPENETRKRCTMVCPDWLTQLHQEKRSFIIVMGHYGNWEWAGPAFTLNTPYQLYVIYRPLTHPYFDRMMVKMRTRFGTRIIKVNNTLREMVSNRKEISATAFIADQTAAADMAYWTEFLNQDTAVFTGTEKLAKKFNYPVVFINIERPKRGHYVITPELLFLNPQQTAENEITETFTRRLEKQIIAEPSFWLWSHKRWKHTRPI